MTQVDPCMTQVDPSWAKFSPFEAKIGPWEVFGEADPACSWNFFTFPTAIRFDSFLTFSDFKHPTLMKLCHKMQCVWPKWTLRLAVKFCSNFVDIQFCWYTNTQRNFLTSLPSILHNLVSMSVHLLWFLKGRQNLSLKLVPARPKMPPVMAKMDFLRSSY